MVSIKAYCTDVTVGLSVKKHVTTCKGHISLIYSRVDEALAGNSVHKGRDSHSAGTEVWVGLPFSQALLHGCPLLPLAHCPTASWLALALWTMLIYHSITLHSGHLSQHYLALRSSITALPYMQCVISLGG